MAKFVSLKVSAIVFVVLASIISLFPPFLFHWDKQYDFIFRSDHYTRKILFGELIVEYIFAFLISIISGYLTQSFITRKEKMFNHKKIKTSIEKGAGLNLKEKDETIDFDEKLLNKYIFIGTFHIENGITKFPEWCNIMIDGLGKTIEPYLKDIWEKILQDHKEFLPDITASKAHNDYRDCFCPACLEESSLESMGNLELVNFIGIGSYNVGHKCKTCNSYVAYKSYMFFLFPFKLYGNYRVKVLGTYSTFWGNRTRFISRKIIDQAKYKFNIFRWWVV